jgi:4-hydroxy 2-oxovalerate aldolase
MAKIKLLDCTLRDGGYVNNWNFGKIGIRSIVTRLASAGVDIIEVGFIDQKVEYDIERSIYPDVQSIGKTLGNISMGEAKLYAMIEFPAFPADGLIPKNQASIDGIRVSFKKGEIDAVNPLALKIKSLGYELSLNPMALFSYSDAEILELIAKINAINPTLVAIADTYGVMFNYEASAYLNLFDRNLNREIAVGFHSHNNMQMSNAICVDFSGKDTLRQLVADASLLGMGKNAGNACTEIVASYLTKTGKRRFDVAAIIETALTDVIKFQKAGAWGYDIKYLVSAVKECSPKVVDYFIKLNGLSIVDIFAIIDTLPPERRIPSYFTPEIGREKYVEFARENAEEPDSGFIQKLKSKQILLVAPGNSVVREIEKIRRYISEKNLLAVSVNHIPEMLEAEYVFVSNPRRYSQVIAQCVDFPPGKTPELIITSNISPVKMAMPQHRVNFAKLFEKCGGDSSVALFLALLLSTGVDSVWVAGVDGFSEANNFSVPNYEIFGNIASKDYVRRNEDAVKQLRNIPEMTINWITPSIIKDMLCEM